MKATDKPQFSKKWWTTEKPDDVKGSDLEKALQAAEKALADEKKNSEPGAVDACIATLGDVCSAADRTIKKELDKKKHKDQIAVLEKFDALVKAELKRLEDVKAKLEKAAKEEDEGEEGEDEEESEDKIFQKEYVYKMLKLLRSTGKELNFGFGLNTKDPSASKLVLTRKGKPERLFKALKQSGEFSNRLITYGKTVPDAKDGKTLVFMLTESAGEPPQIQKLGRQFLRGDKNLKFRKLKLVLPGGQTLEDNEPDPEDAGQAPPTGGADLSKELAAVERLTAEWQQVLREVSAKIDQLRKAIDNQNDAALRNISDGLGKVVQQFPDLDLSKLAAAAKSNDRAGYDRTLTQTAKEVGDVYRMLADGPLLSTIDENPFVQMNVQSTVKSVLQRVTSELKMKA